MLKLLDYFSFVFTKPLAIIWNIQEKKDGNVNITSCGEYAIIPKDFFYDLLKNQYEKDAQ